MEIYTLITLEIFNIKLNVKDGDIMDWGMKDYKANGFPDKVTDMDGNVLSSNWL